MKGSCGCYYGCTNCMSTDEIEQRKKLSPRVVAHNEKRKSDLAKKLNPNRSR